SRSTMFFFSSRRRHTRSKRDWSSDVCSSDLLERLAEPGGICVSGRVQEDAAGKLDLAFEDIGEQALKISPVQSGRTGCAPPSHQIGRASCRERAEMAGGSVAVSTKRDNIDMV